MCLRDAISLLLTIAAIFMGLAATAAAPGPTVVYTTKIVERHGPQCSRGLSDCPVYIRFRYPVIVRAANPAVARAITGAIDDFLLTGLGESRKFSSVEAEMDEFMRSYEEFRKVSPGIGYSEDRNVCVLYQANGIFSLDFDLGWFFGTAHPDGTRTFANFDERTGRQIRLADVLAVGFQPRLTHIAEKHFRESKGLKPTDSLREAGYEFPNDAFALNDNFSIGAKGITFLYNTYEIASYADGPTELFLTYHEIKDLLKPGGLLGSLRE